MNSHSNTVQVVTLGLAFLSLFVGAVASLGASEEAVLYITQAHASSSAQTELAANADTDSTSAETGAELYASSWSPQFAAVAFAASADGHLDETLEQMSGIPGLGDKTPKQIHRSAQKRAERSRTKNPVMTQADKREILWLARIMYSETKRPYEQRLIGWVVRNRVDTGYTGRTYEDVAKHSKQFSGLNPYDKRYEHNMSRWYSSDGEAWETAVAIAKEVYLADDSERPLSLTTRHFYSPHAVRQQPAWAQNREAVQVIKDPNTNQVRFALYDQVR